MRFELITTQTDNAAGPGAPHFKFMMGTQSATNAVIEYCAENIRPPWKYSKYSQLPSKCRRPYGQGKGYCNATNQATCVRSSKCLCGISKTKYPDVSVKDVESKLADQTKSGDDIAMLYGWWGSMCTCDIADLDFPAYATDQSNRSFLTSLFQPISVKSSDQSVSLP